MDNLQFSDENKKVFYICCGVAILVFLVLCIMLLIYCTKKDSYNSFDWKEKLEKQGVIQYMAENMTDGADPGLTSEGVKIVFTPNKSTMPVLKQEGDTVYIPNSYTYKDKQSSYGFFYPLPADEKELESDKSYSDIHLNRVRNRIDSFKSYKPRTMADTRGMTTQEAGKMW